MLPSMWREELLHPLTVHFPLALLILGSAFYILSVLMKRIYFSENLKFTSLLMITVGTITAWLANYTGGVAEEIVGSTLCDPDIRMLHEDYAYYATYIFSSFVVLEVFKKFTSMFFSKLIVTLNIVLVISGSGFLMYVGHLGASLVYQQAAGVYNPGPQCTGY